MALGAYLLMVPQEGGGGGGGGAFFEKGGFFFFQKLTNLWNKGFIFILKRAITETIKRTTIQGVFT